MKQLLRQNLDPLTQVPCDPAVDQNLIVFRDNREPTLAARKGRRLQAVGQGDLIGQFGAIHLGEAHDKEPDDR